MEAANRSGEAIVTEIALGALRIDSLLLKLPAAKSAREEAAFVAVRFEVDDKGSNDGGRFELHLESGSERRFRTEMGNEGRGPEHSHVSADLIAGHVDDFFGTGVLGIAVPDDGFGDGSFKTPARFPAEQALRFGNIES